MIWKEDIATLQQLMNESCVENRKEVSDSLLPPRQGHYLPPPASLGTYRNIQTLK